jgi:CBS domain containing-hemolysin-like protein
MRQPEEVVITMLLGTNVADYLATAFTAALLLHLAVAESLAEVYATLIVTPLILVFGGIIPKDWFRREADWLMYRLALPVEICVRLARATGFVFLLRGLTHLLVRWIDPAHVEAQRSVLPRAQALRLLREGAVHGGLSKLQRDLMDRVVNLSHTSVSSVMVPRSRAALVAKDIPRGDLLRAVRMAHFSRLPIYDGSPTTIIGILNVYDVLTDTDERPIEVHMHEPFRLPASDSVAKALVRMQQARQVMAIVEDAQGRCVGLLTVKDLVQQIVGYIEQW